MDWNMILGLVVVLGCLIYGVRFGGLGLAVVAGVGLAILTFGLDLPAGKPPIDVMLTILAVVTCSGFLQASGGLNVMLKYAEKLLRRNPKYVTILAPITTWFLTVLCGTGHVVYTMFPIIYDIAIKENIRPERPMACASVASQMGICASPASVAVVSIVTLLAGTDFHPSVLQILMVSVPATFCGVLVAACWSIFRGKDLDKDSEFQAKLKDPEQRAYIYGETDGERAGLADLKLPRSAYRATFIFLCGILVIAILGNVPSLLPHFQKEVSWSESEQVILQKVEKNANTGVKVLLGGMPALPKDLVKDVAAGDEGETGVSATSVTVPKASDAAAASAPAEPQKLNFDVKTKIVKIMTKPMTMTNVIQIAMLTVAMLIMVFCKVKASDVTTCTVFKAGMVAVISVYGVAWMAQTYFGTYLPQVKTFLGELIIDYPWTYAIAAFLISKLVNSQAAALAIVVPMALSIGVPTLTIISFISASYGYFVLPTYPSDLACIGFDRSGTTRIGKFVINHSFIMPGLIGVAVGCAVGYALAHTIL